MMTMAILRKCVWMSLSRNRKSLLSQAQYIHKIICSYKVERECWPKSQRVCVTLPSTECTMEAGFTCDIEESQYCRV